MTTGRLASPLSALEIASGLVFGRESRVRIRPSATPRHPLEALEQELLPALRTPPCLVSFSGGRDSSCVLAAAVALARKTGLPLPVPVTNRFPEAPETDESPWQERVIAHLRLSDWHRIEFGDELDPVGPVACRGIERHGLLWPFNAHFHVPLLEAAAGGSLLTGIGGDEVFGESRWSRANDVLARRVSPVPRDALPVVLALAPRAVRRAVLVRRATRLPWLTSVGERALARAAGAHEASEPRRYARRLEWWHGLRAFRVGFASLELLALDAGARLFHPLASGGFAAALVRAAPKRGPVERGAFMREVFGDLLPAEVYARRTKVMFDQAFWGSHARALAEQWGGEGADPELVDADALRQEWLRPAPDGHTFTLLQSAWLARRPRAVNVPPTLSTMPASSPAAAATNAAG